MSLSDFLSLFVDTQLFRQLLEEHPAQLAIYTFLAFLVGFAFGRSWQKRRDRSAGSHRPPTLGERIQSRRADRNMARIGTITTSKRER